jgi:AraC-like DNA-binding protein
MWRHGGVSSARTSGDTRDCLPIIGGAQGDRMRHLATFGGNAHRIAPAVKSIRENFDQPMRIEELAFELAMSVSSFHAHFKAVTTMSPLQFQKQLRLQEARRLMINDSLDAAEAGFGSVTKTPRISVENTGDNSEKPPMRDVEGLRGLATV